MRAGHLFIPRYGTGNIKVRFPVCLFSGINHCVYFKRFNVVSSAELKLMDK